MKYIKKMKFSELFLAALIVGLFISSISGMITDFNVFSIFVVAISTGGLVLMIKGMRENYLEEKNAPKLIELIKKSNVVSIDPKQGADLLLNKLNKHSDIKAKIYYGDGKLSELPKEGNIIIDDLDESPNDLTSPPFLRSARLTEYLNFAHWRKKRRVFLVTNHAPAYMADLKIFVKGVSKDKKHLNLLVCGGNDGGDKKINLTSQDFSDYDTYLTEKTKKYQELENLPEEINNYA